MAFRFFTVPIQGDESASAELNRFLGSHRIVKVERQFIDQGTSSLWALCVEYVLGANVVEPGKRPEPIRPKTDYKELLSPADFAVFARLRDARKAISQTEAVPVYTIFTNEQLAQMVTSKATTKAALGKIDGVGEARLAKYGQKMLAILTTAWQGETSTTARRIDIMRAQI